MVTFVDVGRDESGGLKRETEGDQHCGGERSVPEHTSESVRAMTKLLTPMMSYCSRMATRRLMCSEMGTKTLPAM